MRSGDTLHVEPPDAAALRESNCMREGMRAFAADLQAWRAAGAEAGAEPYIVLRPSRHPGAPFHVLVGRYDPGTDQIAVRSFKPVQPVGLPWWQAWRRWRFLGRWVQGDWPPTVPAVRRR